MVNRERTVRFLIRRPHTLEPRIARWTVVALAGIGAGFLVWSGVIHLDLWADGYKDISVIGPLFLVQGIASILLAVAIVAFRWLALLAAGAVAGLATGAGLLVFTEAQNFSAFLRSEVPVLSCTRFPRT